MIDLWAPHARSVEIDALADGAELREPLTKRPDGWWHWEGRPDDHAVFDYLSLIHI